GLLLHKPREPRIPLAEGLRPPGDERHVEAGQTGYLGQLRVEEVTRRGDEGEDELVDPRDGSLPLALHTKEGPGYHDKDGGADNLIGKARHVMGVVEEFPFDRLLDALRVGVATCPVNPDGERLTLSDDGATLEVRTRYETLSLRTPLFSLHKY